MLSDCVLSNLIEYLDPVASEQRPAYEVQAKRIITKYPRILGLHSKGQNQITPLIAGVMNPHHCCSQELFTMLLQKPTNLNAAKDCGRTAIHYLCYANRADYLKQLLAAGEVDINPTSHAVLFTPLHLAVMSASNEAAQVLLSTGKVKMDALTNKKQNALHIACFFGQLTSDNRDKPPITEEVALRYEKMIDVLLAAGIKVNQADVDGRTPLFYLASVKMPLEIKQRVMFKLIEHGARASLVDNTKNSASRFASKTGHSDFAQMVQENVVPSLRWYCAKVVAHERANHQTNIEEIDSALQKMRLGVGK